MAQGIDDANAALPLVQEHLVVGKRRVETGRVRVSVTTDIEDRVVRESLRSERAELERVPINRELADGEPAPAMRQEADGTVVVPVLEEVLVVERRLVLKEEIRMRLVAVDEAVEQPMAVRRQRASVERLPPLPSRRRPCGRGVTPRPPNQRCMPENGVEPARAPARRVPMATRTITALFDSRAEADEAAQALKSEIGLAGSAVRVEAGAAGGAAPAREDKGFFASLRDMFIPDEDRPTYAEGVRRGGAMVSAQVEEPHTDAAMDVLERHGAVDLDEREAEWRKGGWTGAGAGAAAGTGAVVGASSDGTRTGASVMPGASAPDGAPGNPPGTMLSRGVDQAAGTDTSGAHPENERTGLHAGAAGAAAAGTAAEPGVDYIPVAEERLTVGKREVSHGRVRVRSYVVETPVEERVSLRQERVDVQRRAVDRPVTAADEALFAERTIEATESAEEAVVAKEARVVEELAVRKTADERVQTVRDTVRHTEVEVEDGRAAPDASTTKAGTTAAPTPRASDPDLS